MLYEKPAYSTSTVYLCSSPARCCCSADRKQCYFARRQDKTDSPSIRPIWAGANYFVLARLLYYIPWLSPIHPGRVLTTFVGIDLLIEVMTGNGASRVANASASKGERKIGVYLIKVSLILQACTFGAYVAILAIWHVRVRREGLLSKKLRPVVLAMYASSALITIRCIYRIVEYFQGYGGELYSHEAYFWVFEAVLMLANSLLLNWMHPGRFLPQDNKVFLATDGKTEVQGPGWRDTRRWYWQLADIFDLRSCCGRTKQIEYWKNTEEEYLHLHSRDGSVVPK